MICRVGRVGISMKPIMPILPAVLVVSSLLAGPRPNVVLIITDDQGYGDLACHGKARGAWWMDGNSTISSVIRGRRPTLRGSTRRWWCA